MINSEEKQYLLRLARQVIEALAAGDSFAEDDFTSANLDEYCGAFVTIHQHGELRGCIGYVEGTRPLKQAVREMAAAAAFEDPRFPQVTKEDVPDLDIEISVLSPIKEINSVDEIEVGKHGLIVKNGLHKGLLLPQVATEQDWNRQQFLEFTCIKAGLHSDAWNDPQTKIQTFTAEIFSE
jgi:AmmeMemoRadiSam system protein A